MSLKTLQYRLSFMPMIKVLVLLIVGILLCMDSFLPLGVVVVGLLIFGVMALVRRSALFFSCVVVLFGVLFTQLDARRYDALNPHSDLLLDLKVLTLPTPRGAAQRVEARLRGWSDLDDSSLRAEAQSVEWCVSSGRVMLWCDTTLDLKVGDEMILAGRIRPVDQQSRYGTLMRARGFVGSCWVDADRIVSVDSVSAGGLHQWGVEHLGRINLGRDAAATVQAMVVGERSFLDSSVSKAYARCGASHLLAVSGLHVGTLFLLVNLLLVWLPLLDRGYQLRNLLVVVLVWLYVAMVGFSPSAVRAAIMFSALQFAMATGSEYGAMNILAATAVVMLSLRPGYLYDVSFQLSFVAVAALIAWYGPLYRAMKVSSAFVNRLLATLLVALVASVAVAPIVSYLFGWISWVGIMLNPLLMITASAILFLGLLVLLLPCDFGPATWLLDRVATLQNQIVSYGASLSFAGVEYRASEGVVVVVYLIFIGATLLLWAKDDKKELSLPHYE